MTHEERAKRVVERILHDAHLRFQREMLRQDEAAINAKLPCPEGRGCHFRMAKAKTTFRPEWFTSLRPNFWKAYFETLRYMSR